MGEFQVSFKKQSNEEFVFSYHMYETYLETNKKFGEPRKYMQSLNNERVIVVADSLGYILYDGQVFGIIPQFCIKIKELTK